MSTPSCMSHARHYVTLQPPARPNVPTELMPTVPPGADQKRLDDPLPAAMRSSSFEEAAAATAA
jgi:hypothetical protein